MGKLVQVWERWIKPAQTIPEQDHFRVRFMAAMVLGVLFFGSIIQLINIVFAPSEQRASLLLGGGLTAVLLFILYRAILSRFYRPAGWLLILAFDFLTLLMVWHQQPLETLRYLLIPILFATLFLSIQNVLGLLAINLFAVLGLVQIVEAITFNDVWTELSYLLFMTALLAGVAHYRNLWERQNQKLLRASRERYRTLLTASFDGMLMIQQGKIRLMNDGLLNLFGYERDEVIERPLTDIIPDGEAALTAVSDHNLGTPPQATVGITKEGLKIDIEISTRHNTYYDKPVHLIAVRDITARVAAETALQQSQARNQALLTTTPDTMMRLSQHGICTDYWPDPIFGRILPADQLFNQHVNAIFPAEQAEKFIFFSQEALASGKTQFFECDLSPDDFTLIYEVRLTPIAGQFELLALIRDVTEQKRAEMMLFDLSQELETRVEERTLKLVEAHKMSQAMQAANLALSKTLDLDIVLNTLLEYLAQLIPYDGANVMLWQAGTAQDGTVQDDTHLRIHAARGYSKLHDLEQIKQRSFEVSHYATLETVINSKSSLLIQDTAKMPDWIIVDSLEDIECWLGIPLLAGGRVIGLYALDKAEAGAFTVLHQQYAEALAAQAAVAIQNALLFEQVRNGREKLRLLAQQIVTTQEDERLRVSRELHDEAGQALTALKIGLAVTLRTISDSDGGISSTESLPTIQLLQKELQNAVNLCELTMDQIRLLAHNLRPAALDDLGLSPALEGFCDDFAERTHLSIEFQHQESLPDVPDVIGITLYRFLQEALTNVARHADATKIDVQLRMDETAVTLSVTDNGQGFELSPSHLSTTHSSGIGLAGMQERLQLLGGQFRITSNPGQGTSLTATIPLTIDTD